MRSVPDVVWTSSRPWGTETNVKSGVYMENVHVRRVQVCHDVESSTWDEQCGS